MANEFGSGAREEIRFAVAGQFANTSATDFQLIPHSGNPTGPHKPGNRGPTDDVAADLQVSDNPLRGFTVPTQFQSLWTYGRHDLMLPLIFRSSGWSSPVNITGTDISSAATGNKLVSGTANKFQDLATQVPCPVWIVRDGSSPISSFAIALSVSGDFLELTIGNGKAIGTDSNAETGHFGVTLSDSLAGDNVTVFHSGVLKHGTTESFGIIERAHVGLTQFDCSVGSMATSWTLNQQKGSDPTSQWNFMGREQFDAGATFGTGTVTAANTNRGFNTGKDMQFFGEGGIFTTDDPTDTTAGLFLTQFNSTTASAAVAVDAMGKDGPTAHQSDRIIPTGSFNLLRNAAGRAIVAKAKAFTDSNLCMANRKTVGGVTNAYFHWYPSIQYTDATPEGGGNAGVSSRGMPWLARKDDTYGLSQVIARFSNMPS